MEQRHEVETSVGRLAVRITGEGPPAVLWHSLFVDDRSWDRLVPRIATGRRLVLITGPGHGASADPGRRYSNEECASAAAVVLDKLGIGHPVDWIGNAWGGHVGAIAAAARPSLVHRLVMLGAPIAALTAWERLRTYLLLALYGVTGPSSMVVDGATDVLLSEHTRSIDADAVNLVQDCLRRADRRRLRNAVVSVSLHRTDLTSTMRRITQPTLIVTGADHHGFTPEQARAAVALPRHARLAIVPDAAYLVPLEAPDATADLINDFWATPGRRDSVTTPQAPSR
jgi:pimeloyl-ACP methyl ester carboxylesterase